jgi:ATP-binding cassette, subfamily B, bacterial MsbA
MQHFNFLKPYWAIFLFILLTGIAASFLEGLGLSFIFPILEEGISETSTKIPFPFDQLTFLFSGMSFPQRLQIVAGLLVAVGVSKGIVLYSNIAAVCKIQILAIKHFRMLFFEQLMTVGMGYYHGKKGGDLHTICYTYIQSLGLVIHLIGNSLAKLFSIIIYLAMVLVLSWKMTFIVVAIAFTASLLMKRVTQKAADAGRKLTAATTKLSSTLFELILSVKVIRIFSQEKHTLAHFDEINDKYNQSYYRSTRIRASVQPIFESIGITFLALVMIVSALFFVETGEIGLSSLAVFLIIFQRISAAALSINHARISLIGDLPMYKEVFNFLSPEGKQYVENGELAFSGLKDEIQLRNVEFSYNSDHDPVMKDISFTIDKGSKVGIVGSSGAGKSSLVELLLRFYDPQKGQLIVDGTDLRQFDIGSWRKNIGVVSQDVFLFNDTLKNNIAYGNPKADQNQIESAARKAYAHEFIQTLPQGYETIVGDRGVLLSGGQKQRIAIARAILIDPEILIFDEATSALDSESEKIVQKALDEVGEGRTVITIAHRLSTIFDSDKIIVMDSGRIVEEGTHQELLEKGGMYNNLIQMQGGSISPVNSSLR